MFERLKKNQFLFEELIKRDFKAKYKRTILGMLWSVLSPLLMLTLMAEIYGNFLGSNSQHNLIYLFSVQFVFKYLTEATKEGMQA